MFWEEFMLPNFHNIYLSQEEHRLRVFENRVLRRIFGLKRDEVTGGWRKLHNEMARACSTNGEKRTAYRILVGKPEGKRPLGRPRHRWVGNIKMDRMVWIGLIWLRIETSGGLL
jgi:hypothetical protein